MANLEDRVSAARKRCDARLRDNFAKAGLNYPARTVLLRAFKHERLLELWGTTEVGAAAGFRLVGAFPVLGASGTLGPKRREGDRQVPEGFYRVTRFNPRSRFHLSLGLNYPNASDLRLTTDPQSPGSDIFIHGGTESKGCLAMGDATMEFLYLAACDAQEVHVHLFPCRMDHPASAEVLDGIAAASPELQVFWRGLRTGYRQFVETHRLPVVEVDASGFYTCIR